MSIYVSNTHLWYSVFLIILLSSKVSILKMVLTNQLKLDIVREYYKNGESICATRRALTKLYNRDNTVRKIANMTIWVFGGLSRNLERNIHCWRTCHTAEVEPYGLGLETLEFRLIGTYFFEDDSGSAETVKTEKYLKMMRTWFIPQLKIKRIFKDVVFQEDGASSHCSKEAIEWLTSQFTSDRLILRNLSFKRPPYSSDLNPCDCFLWGYLKSKVYSPYPSTTEELKKNVRREFKKISKETIGKVVENFAARAQLVISKKGGWLEQIFNN